MTKSAATYGFAMDRDGSVIVMRDSDGNATTIETTRSEKQAIKRVAYWTKQEAKANKKVAAHDR